MAWSGDVIGLDAVIKNLNLGIAQIKGGTTKGLILSLALIRNDTETTSPLTPVDLGNLRASWFVVTTKGISVGRGEKQFKGPKAGEMLSEHQSTVMECQAITKEKALTRIMAIGGYSANYAVYVHENIGAVNWKRAGSGPKWLEWAFKRNTDKILLIIADNAKV